MSNIEETKVEETKVEATEAVAEALNQYKPRTERYLRNRPFLMVSIAARPARGVHTHVKGWGDTYTNWEQTEQRIVTDRVNAVHLRDYNVIIDVLNRKIVKNVFKENTPDDEVVNHFMNRYQNEIQEAMDIWMRDFAAKVGANAAAAAKG